MPNPLKTPHHGDTAGPRFASRYAGPERRRTGGAGAALWFDRMLDEVDYGMLLLDERLEVLHVNHAARAELNAQHPLQLRGNALTARRQLDGGPLHDALYSAARRGLRRLLSVGEGGDAVSVAVVPLDGAGDGRAGAALVVLGKRAMCGELSVQWFARNHALTHAETRVLAALCQGHDPSEIACSLGVALNTVRTQIGSVRAKTRAVSIRQLIRQVSMLPPLVSVIRGAAIAGGVQQPGGGVTISG